MEDFFDDRLKERVGPPTLEKCRLLMVRTFDYAPTHGEARVNPLRLGSGIEPLVNSEPHKARTLSSEEIGRILEIARGHEPRRRAGARARGD